MLWNGPACCQAAFLSVGSSTKGASSTRGGGLRAPAMRVSVEDRLEPDVTPGLERGGFGPTEHMTPGDTAGIVIGRYHLLQKSARAVQAMASVKARNMTDSKLDRPRLSQNSATIRNCSRHQKCHRCQGRLSDVSLRAHGRGRNQSGADCPRALNRRWYHRVNRRMYAF
jgi:hypothetical protein